MGLIEYYYSGCLHKFSVRTQGILLEGRGIKVHHEEKDGKPFNVYTVTKKAFEKLEVEYSEQLKLIPTR